MSVCVRFYLCICEYCVCVNQRVCVLIYICENVGLSVCIKKNACLCVCIWVCTFLSVYPRVYACAWMCMGVWFVCVWIYTRENVSLCLCEYCMFMCWYLDKCAWMCLCGFVWVCMCVSEGLYVCMYLCMYQSVYICVIRYRFAYLSTRDSFLFLILNHVWNHLFNII